jgi:uncharacterized protein Yka (UPF0111/DUF47 family)
MTLTMKEVEITKRDNKISEMNAKLEQQNSAMEKYAKLEQQNSAMTKKHEEEMQQALKKQQSLEQRIDGLTAQVTSTIYSVFHTFFLFRSPRINFTIFQLTFHC